jgi:hypothetical protein
LNIESIFGCQIIFNKNEQGHESREGKIMTIAIKEGYYL